MIFWCFEISFEDLKNKAKKCHFQSGIKKSFNPWVNSFPSFLSFQPLLSTVCHCFGQSNDPNNFVKLSCSHHFFTVYTFCCPIEILCLLVVYWCKFDYQCQEWLLLNQWMAIPHQHLLSEICPLFCAQPFTMHSAN